MIEQLYNVEEVAKILRVSKHTVRAWYYQGRLKGIKLGRRLVFSEKSIRNLIDG